MGGSRFNISILIAESDKEAALTRLHHLFSEENILADHV